jgi:hypothetical protein
VQGSEDDEEIIIEYVTAPADLDFLQPGSREREQEEEEEPGYGGLGLGATAGLGAAPGLGSAIGLGSTPTPAPTVRYTVSMQQCLLHIESCRL